MLPRIRLLLVFAAIAQAAATTEGQSLIAHWKLNESSGTSAADSSGSGYTGTVSGTASWTSGYINNAFSFNGSTRIQATGLLGNRANLTVAAWANLTAADSNGAEVISLGDHFMLRLDEGGASKAVLYNGSTWIDVTYSQVYAGAGWHHFAAVFDDANNTFRLYVDGAQVASTATTSSISYSGLGTNTSIGRHGNGGTTWDFTGRIDDVRVYDYALSSAEIQDLYSRIGHWKLSETSGTTAADSSAYTKNGTVTGTAAWSTDCGGAGVFDFNGSSNYISTTNGLHLQPTSTLTIAAWIKGDSWGSGTDVSTILRKGEANPNNYALAISDGRVEVLLDGNDGGGIRGNTVLSTGQWYHVAAVWNGSTVRLFVNGVLDNTPPTRTGTIGADSRALYIGGRSGADLFDGMIREVQFFNRGLSDTEIKKLAGLVGFWKFAEGSGTATADSSGQSLAATLVGGAGWITSCAGDKALSTNGSGGIAQTNATISPPDSGTVAFWMQSSGTPSSVARILGVGGDWEIRQNPDGRIISDLCGDGGTTIGTVTPLTEVNRWYHFAATFDSGTNSYAIYVDGQLESSGVNPNNMTQQPSGILSFGTRTGSTEYWQGALRHVRVYSRCLCAKEIAELAGNVGAWKLDEISGITAADSSPAVNNGTYINGPTIGGAGPTTGTKAAQFDGSNDYVNLPANISDYSNGLTIAAWAYPTSTGAWARFVGFGGGEDQYNFFLSRVGTTSELELGLHGGTLDAPSAGAKRYVRASNTIVQNEWHHYAATINSTGVAKLYKDAVELTISSGSTGYPTIGLPVTVARGSNHIARSNWAADAYYQGKLWDGRVYNRCLCPSEIQALYDAGASTFQGVKIIKWVEIQ